MEGFLSKEQSDNRSAKIPARRLFVGMLPSIVRRVFRNRIVKLADDAVEKVG
jgi:hypothetical protein